MFHNGNAMRYNSGAVFDGYTAGGTGSYKYRMYVDGDDAFCIQPGVPLRTDNTLKKNSSETWNGVTEDTIEAIRLYDPQAFNSDRRYYGRVQETGIYLDTVAASTDQAELKTVQDFLDHIENQELYHVLITVDRLTLQIVLMKIQGYSTHEIARYLKITEKAVYRRMDRLKEKVKKIFE